MQTTSATQNRTSSFFDRPLSFWRKVLLINSAGVGIFGLAMILFRDTFDRLLFNPMLLNPLFSNEKLHMTGTPEIMAFIHELYIVLGAFVAGWGVLLYLHIKNTFDTGDIRNWNAVVASVATWYVLDSSFSIAIGYAPTAIVNTISAIAFLIPLMASKKYFKKIDHAKVD